MRASGSFIVAAVLLCAGCGKAPKAWTEQEIIDLAASHNGGRIDVGVLEAKLVELEDRIETLERENDELESKVSRLEYQ